MADETLAGTLEDLDARPPPSTATALTARPPPSRPSTLTRPMQVTLELTLILFMVWLMVPALLVVWAIVVGSGAAIGGVVLLKVHALDATTVRPAFMVGTILGALLAAAELRTAREDTVTAPFVMLGYLVALAAAVCVFAAARSAFFPYPLASVTVSATLVYLALVTLVALGRCWYGLQRSLHDWAERGAYRAGFLTATFLLTSATVGVLLHAGYVKPIVVAAAAELELADVPPPRGVLDAGPALLCLGAGEVAPAAARDGAEAPACQFLPGATTACLESLSGDVFSRTVGHLRKRYACDDECHDLALDALLTTCTEHGGPRRRNVAGYFVTVAGNNAKRWATRGARIARGEAVDELPDDPCSWVVDDGRDDRLRTASEEAKGKMTSLERAIVRERLEGGASFQAIGARHRMTERQARNLYHNTLAQLRKELAGWRAKCDF